MAPLLTILYIAVSHLSPADMLPDLAPYRPLVWLMLVAVLASLPAIATNAYRLRARQVFFLVGLFAVVLISPVMHGWFGGVPVAFSAFAPVASAFFLCVISLQTIRHMRLVTLSLILVALYMAVSGLMAYASGYQEDLFINEWPPKSEQVPGRPVMRRVCGLGFLHDPNDFAQFLLIVLPFIWIAWRERSAIRNAILVILPTLVIGFTMIRTQSRGGFLGLGAMILVSVRRRAGTTLSVLLVVVMLVGIFAGGILSRNSLSVREDSAAGRVEAWGNGIAMWKSNPLFGVGYGQFGENNADQSGLTAHNSFVLCFAELGTAGYMLWLALIISTLLDLNSLAATPIAGDRGTAELTRWAGALRLSLVGYLTTAWFLSRTYVMTLYVLIGISVALIGMAHKDIEQEISPDMRRVFSWATLTALCSVALLYCTLWTRAA